jgi:endo-1,4-beta-xylanase
MKISQNYLLTILLVTNILGACSKSDTPDVVTPPTPPPPVNPADTATTLKGAAAFPLGFGIDYSSFMNDASYKGTVVKEGDNVTFGYDMKHGAIVRNDGTFDFTRADALFNAATNAGLQVFGHTLVWHQNQNATYLNSLGTTTVAGPNVLLNGGFESGTGDEFSNWAKYNGGVSILAGSGATEVHGGNRSFKAVVTAPGNAWSVQLASDLFNTTIGTSYKVSFWIKAASSGGKMRVSTGPTGSLAKYMPDYSTTTDWTLVEWSFVAGEENTGILFDVGLAANTYYIDDVTVQSLSSSGGGVTAEVVAKVDSAMSRFIRASMMRYAGRVKAWDVVNEPMADGSGALRTEANSNIPSGATDYFMWTKYLGRDYALKAFQYARAADPNALLFINDYNLESNTRKLDSLIAYVTYLKSKGAPIDGIGTQMHMSISTSQAAISDMFRKLAATGLKIRVSELDIRVNPTDVQGFTPSSTVLTQQADMYGFVVRSYVQNVPEAQRHGLTIWGVTDADSWIVNFMKKTDFPLLYNRDYSKKPAFSSTLNALKGK